MLRAWDIPESLSLPQEAQEQLGQDQEQELLKQLKEQHQSVTKVAIRQSHIQPIKSCWIKIPKHQTCENVNWGLLRLLATENILRSVRVFQFSLFRYSKA